MRLRRRHLPLAALVLLTSLGASPPAKPEPSSGPALTWQAPGSERAAAEKLHKPILYLFTAEWCAPCHQLKRKVFEDPVQSKRIAERFIPIEVQDTRRERGSNVPEVTEILLRYGVSSLPTLLVAMPDGKEVNRLRGYAGVDATVRFLDMQHLVAQQTLGHL